VVAENELAGAQSKPQALKRDTLRRLNGPT
jgi:hypothetical protein